MKSSAVRDSRPTFTFGGIKVRFGDERASVDGVIRGGIDAYLNLGRMRPPSQVRSVRKYYDWMRIFFAEDLGTILDTERPATPKQKIQALKRLLAVSPEGVAILCQKLPQKPGAR